ncbi:MAG: DUF885 domain-containing protein [Acidobacteria bacterium]|nr:MAG: DUF885 domain-containing protein [Acidobacteriota bacterium]
MRIGSLAFMIMAGALLAPLALSADHPTLEARRKSLNRLLADEWEYEVRESPELATLLGDYRYNDRWSDFSLAHVQEQKDDLAHWVARFAAIDTTGFPEQEKLNQVLMLRNLKERIEAINLKTFEMPIDQQDGAHLQFAEALTIIPFNTTRQYEDYLARLRALPRALDQITGILQQGLKDKLIPPRYLLEKTVKQCDDIAAPAGDANTFAQPLTHFPEAVSEADRKRLRAAIIAAIDQELRPAYRKLSRFLAQDYAPKGRAQEGIWSLPNGDALYRFDIRQQTTTSMDPETIHQLGLREVERIEAEQLIIAKKLGFSDLKSFRASLATNPKLIPTSREQILETYLRYIAQMSPQLPKLFGLLPPTQLDVKPVEEFREKDAPSAEYIPGTPDGSRRGTVMVNTGDHQHRSLVACESTAYHEGVPGHHMQISIAQTLTALPTFRQQAGYNAYVEGWALYSESLGKDVGFYQDAYSDFGRLSDELLRAVRLVLDTGVHYKHWTRAQMVDYFHAHSAEDEPDVQSETDRYIAAPAQALGYKLGQLDILRLRQLAQKELGPRYDIRSFHDEVLNGGALPLDVLDQRVTSWIAEQKAASNSQSGSAK